MTRVLKKFRNNLFNGHAIRVLGPYQYLRYVGHFLIRLPLVIRDRNLLSLDKPVGQKLSKFNYRGRQIQYECRFGDDRIDTGLLEGGTYAFGFIREIYLRDCYFKYLPPGIWEESRVIMDLGVNCGIFSALMSPHAEFIVGVDCNPAFMPVVEYNLKLNGFDNFALECGFIGSGGMFETEDAKYISLEELFERHPLERIDLLKLDIEGSEFPLFESDAWLERVGAITMEVHQGYPGLDTMLDALDRNGFEMVLANEDLQRVERPTEAAFLYAWKSGKF